MKNLSSITNTVISRLLVFLIFLSVSSVAHGQSPPKTLVPGTAVIGLCQGHETEPGCVLPNLFGQDGLTLQLNSGTFQHYAHFIGSAQEIINQTVSSAIATQLAVLPIISPSSGFTYKYDSETGAFVRTMTSFGPIFAERAETIGRGKLMTGSSYQRFRFDSLDGISLHSVPVVFSHVRNTGPGNAPETYESDVITSTNNINVNMDQTMLFGTVGITNRLDVSIAVPIVSVRVGASSNDQIDRVSGPTFVLDGNPPRILGNPHQFPNGTLQNVYSSSGSAAGIGDVTVRVKGNVFQSESVRIALAMDVRTPTGDARQFLGSGAVGIKPFLIVSLRKRFSPHANLGYQWNGKSILAGNITGASIFDDSTGTAVIQEGPAVKESLPSQFFGTLGVDVGLPGRFTLAFDYLGQALHDAPRVFRTTQQTDNIPGGTGTQFLPTISGGKDNVVLSSGSAGFKYNLFNNILLTGNVLFRLDNKGLRQNVTPLAALTYSFGR